MPAKPPFPKPLPCSPSPKSNSLWHKKGEFVLMFAENWENKLDGDLANQNSLQKLSDPGGSRALDKQDWLFQKHAYITPIWAGAITHRQLGKKKANSDHICLVGKHGEIRRLSMLKWEIFLIKCSGSAAWETFTVEPCKHMCIRDTKRQQKNCCISLTSEMIVTRSQRKCLKYEKYTSNIRFLVISEFTRTRKA